MKVGVVLLVATLGALLAPSMAAAVARADLVVSSVSKPPASVERTGGLDVTSRVRNVGGGKAKASATTFYLSQVRRKVRNAIRLNPRQLIPVLAARGGAGGTVTVTVPRSAKLGSYYLIACADGGGKVSERNEANNCRSSSRRVKVTAAKKPAAGKTSAELIDAAVSSHKISSETGALFKVYAFHRDPQLPPEYRGQNSRALADSALADVGSTLGSFSPAIQAKLRPFFVPPYYSASWWAIQRGQSALAASRSASLAGSPRCGAVLKTWDFLDTADGNFRIWWETKNPADGGFAAARGSDLKGTIYPALGGLMKKSILDDGATAMCEGGSNRFDIAVADVSPAETITDDLSCSETTSHINMPQGTTRSVLAHELMHAFQYRYKTGGGCKEYRWLREATAQWAMEFVYHSDNGEHDFDANKFFLDDPSLELEYSNAKHEYGAWIFAFFLSKKFSPDKIQEIWAAAASNSDSLKAIDDVAPFAGLWPEFAFDNWNRSPFDFYQSWDPPFTEAAATSSLDGSVDNSKIDLVLDGAGNALRQVHVPVGHLSARYYDFDLSSSSVRSLAFRSFLFTPGYVQALVRTGQAWKDMGDWSATTSPKFFCRDVAAEKVEELVLIVSNSSYDRSSVLDMGSTPPSVLGTNVGCRRWVGSFSGTATTKNASETLTETWSGTASFERGASSPMILESKSAGITWSLTGTLDVGTETCTVAAGPAVLSAPDAGDVELAGTNFQYPRAYRIFLAHTDDVAGQITCPSAPASFPYTAHPHGVWLETSRSAGEFSQVAADGSIKGTISQGPDATGKTVDWHWDFSAQ